LCVTLGLGAPARGQDPLIDEASGHLQKGIGFLRQAAEGQESTLSEALTAFEASADACLRFWRKKPAKAYLVEGKLKNLEFLIVWTDHLLQARGVATSRSKAASKPTPEPEPPAGSVPEPTPTNPSSSAPADPAPSPSPVPEAPPPLPPPAESSPPPPAPKNREEEIERVKVLTAQARETDPSRRAGAVRDLGALGSRLGIPCLMELFRGERDPGVRVALVEALGGMDHRDVVQGLANIARMDDPAMRSEAVNVLKRISGPAAAQALGGFLAPREEDAASRAALEALGTMGAEGAAALAAGLKTCPPAMRAKLVIALGATGEERAAYALTPLLLRRPPSPQLVELRGTAVEALKKLELKAVPALLQSLDVADLRQWSAHVLREITGQTFGIDRDRWVDWWNKQRKKG
jgi:HEAT repeat protein